MEKISNNHFILILCGGTGPRLWPLSRADRPKQFLRIFNNVSLLEQTLLRALKTVSNNRIFIVSNKNYQSKIEKITGTIIPKNHILLEPIKKNTAMAIVYALSEIQKINPNGIVTTFPSDHYISKLTEFENSIIKSADIAENTDKIVTFGIKPTSPNSSFGYLITDKNKNGYQIVRKFKEKPKLKLSEKLIKDGAYWNAGIYTFKISTLIEELKNNQPKYFKLYKKLIKSKKTSDLEQVYKKSPNLSFDVAFSEKSKNLALIPADFYWNDMGEWKNIYNEFKKNEFDILNISKTNILEVNSKKCLVSSSEKKLIGLVDVNNLAIIDTSDALLVCNIAYDGSSKVRNIVKKIVKNKKLINYFLKSPKND